MVIWANLLGTIEDKINFAAIPANNHYTSNERTEIARAGATKILDSTISQLQTCQKGACLKLALTNFYHDITILLLPEKVCSCQIYDLVSTAI